MKDKWVGICGMCGAKDQKLSTTQSKVGPMNYWIRKCCDHCQATMRLNIDHTMLILAADERTLRKNERKV
jgi:hypothetical protein